MIVSLEEVVNQTLFVIYYCCATLILELWKQPEFARSSRLVERVPLKDQG